MVWRTQTADDQIEARGGIGELIRLQDDGNGNPALPTGISGANLSGTTKRISWSYALIKIQMSNTYQDLAYLIWDGTDEYGKIPIAAVGVAYEDKNSDFQLRIYDTTNNQVIAETGTLSNITGPELINFPAPANYSTDRAVWVIQGRRVGGAGNVKLILGALQIDF